MQTKEQYEQELAEWIKQNPGFDPDYICEEYEDRDRDYDEDEE